MLLLPRLLFLFMLLILMLVGRRTVMAALLRGFSLKADARPYSRSATELSTKLDKASGLNRHGVKMVAERASRSHQGIEAQAKDPRYKDKIIRHLTGPLSFNPKCRKLFNRLYHNTRDCTVPAYYKRCARLLIQLANSPRCTE